jgi:hypothetical protein
MNHGTVVNKILQSKQNRRRRMEEVDCDGWKIVKMIYGR